MALLYRFTRLNDRSNTGVFTFIVTRSVTRDLHRDATTKDFPFGYHRWALSFVRNEKVLGVFLVIRNPAPGSRCYLDFTFTLLNREHFSKNEVLSEKQVRFTAEQAAHGSAKWILMTDLQSRRFSDETGEFLLELSLANASTVFEADIRVPAHVSNHHHGPHHRHHHHYHKDYSAGAASATRLESSFFCFGGFEWNVSLLPNGSPEDGDNGRPRVLLNRLTGFDHPCRVQYRVVLGEGDRKAESGLLDQISDLSGRIRGYPLRGTAADLVRRAGLIRLHLHMISANAISEAKVPAVNREQTLAGRDPAETAVANCYDRDKQAWCVEADLDSDVVRLKLFYADLHHVPRGHLRYVAWNAYLIRRDPDSGARESVLAVHAPHSCYYVQDGMDVGVVMDTDVSVREIRESASMYLDSSGHLTVHVEWLDSQLLFGATYHKYDDIARLQCHQMKREISALQAENYNLERQVFSYQKSISYASARGQPSDDLPEDYYANHVRRLSEAQSLSESEYA
ncbi:uncharacterized protein LOC135377855 [Ornithodoros turicata]|uniref:uncharacterized protein LOC135377855 n=1 Tax=Ornithodoros turicata TaxID=34597 RepID=UPI00313940A3